MDAMNNPSVLEFHGCLFGTIELLDLSNMKLSCTEIWVVTKYLMRLDLFDCCNMITVKTKRLKLSFKTITNVLGIGCQANTV